MFLALPLLILMKELVDSSLYCLFLELVLLSPNLPFSKLGLFSFCVEGCLNLLY